MAQGVYGNVGFVVAATDLLTIGDANIENLEPSSPSHVRFGLRLKAPTIGAYDESAALYYRRDTTSEHRYCLYAEVDSGQAIDGSCVSKVVHRGLGDAHYVAICGNGTSAYGYEAALFGGDQGGGVDKQENGYIVTFQGAAGYPISRKKQSNSTAFQVLVHSDGVNPKSPDDWNTNYGLFYANNALSNAFVARVSEYASNFAQFKVMDHTAYQRPRWAVYSDGTQYMDGLEATVGAPQKNSPEFKLRGKYYATGAEHTANAMLKTFVSGANLPYLYVYTGDEGSEALVCAFSSAGLDMQNHAISTVLSLTLYPGTGTGLDMQGKDIINFGALAFVVGNEQTTVGAAGGASALPATPTKYLKVRDSAGATLVIPAYAVS